MKKQFKIQNLNQLRALGLSFKRNDQFLNRFFTGEVKVTFDLFEFLHESPLEIIPEKSKNSNSISFFDENGNYLITYLQLENVLIYHKEGEDQEQYELTELESYDIEEGEDYQNAYNAFLSFLNLDLGDYSFPDDYKGDWEDALHIHMLVFGFEYKK